MLYKTIAKVEKARGNNLLEALALEKAIELCPDDKDALFDAAYAQSMANEHLLSVNNYDTLVKLSPDHSTALNNLGVSAFGLKIPSKAIHFYKQLIELGNTLAMANLAQKFVEHGFLQEAKDILKLSENHEEIHENIPKAQSSLHQKQNEEEKKWDQILKESHLHCKLMRSYISCYYNENNELISFVGHWQTNTGVEVNIVVNDNKLSAEWDETIGNTEHTCSLSGDITNNSANIVYKKVPKDKSLTGNLFGIPSSQTYERFAYIDSESKELLIRSKNYENEFNLKFKKLT